MSYRAPVGFDIPTYYPDLDWARWKKTADKLSTLNIDMVRIGVVPWETEPAQLNFVEDVMQDIRSRGWKISMTTAQLANNRDQDYTAAMKAAGDYIKQLNRFAPYTDWWQILNEADAGSWLTGENYGQVYNPDTKMSSRRASMTDEYLETIKTILTIGGGHLKEINPDVKIFTNTTGTLMDDSCETCIWNPFHDIVAPAEDVIGINGYPTEWEEKIYGMPSRIRHLAHRYNKKVCIAETGIPSHGGDEVEQGNNISLMLDYGSRSSDIDVLMLYQFQDRGTDTTNAENLFGIVDTTGAEKESYAPVKQKLEEIH